MNDIVIQIENLSKQYRLGEVSTGSLVHDANRWWHRVRGRDDPYARVTRSNVREEKSYGDEFVWALKDVSFEVRRGEVLGIIGRNGAGKSTLLKIMSRVTAPTSGEARINGRLASLLEVGTGFHPDLTGRENIFMNGAILGMTRAEIAAKLDAIVEFSGCARYLDTPTKRYSSGMVVRLGFAVAAYLEPDIMIVDEVLAVGDAEFQKKCVGKMQDVAGHGRTVLFVSHNMDSVRALTKRCLVLSEGKVELDAPTEEAIERYITPGGEGHLLGSLLPVEKLNLERRALMDPLVSFRALGLAASGRSEIPSGGTLPVLLELAAQDRASGLSIGYTIRHSAGHPVCYGNSSLFELAGPGIWRIRLDLGTLELAPGAYDIALSVQRGDLTETKYLYDILMGAASFRVSSARVDGSVLPPWNSAWGHWLHHDAKVVSVDANTNPAGGYRG